VWTQERRERLAPDARGPLLESRPSRRRPRQGGPRRGGRRCRASSSPKHGRASAGRLWRRLH